MTLTRPVAGDPLSSSNGKPSTQILDEAFDQVDAHELMLKGPAFANPTGGAVAASPITIADTHVLTGFWVLNGTAPVLDSSIGTAWPVPMSNLNVGWWNNSGLVTAFGVNTAAPVAVGTHSHIRVVLAFLNQGTGSTGGSNSRDVSPESIGEWVVSDGPNMTGNVVRKAVTTQHGAFGLHWIPIHTLANVRCVAYHPYRIPLTGRLGQTKIWFALVEFAAQNEIEVATAGSAAKALVIPANFTPTVVDDDTAAHRSRDVGPNKSVLDLRPGNEIIANFNGAKYARQWPKLNQTGVTDEPGSDATLQLYQMFGDVEDGDTLIFPANGKFYIDPNNSLEMYNKSNVTIDGNGSQLIMRKIWTNGAIGFKNCSNVVWKNFRGLGEYAETVLGDALGLGFGTPVRNSSTHTVALDGWGDSVALGSSGTYHPDEDGYVRMDFTATLTGTKTNATGSDVYIEMQDTNAPAITALSRFSTEGTIPFGTYVYRATAVDADGRETGLGSPNWITIPLVAPAWSRVAVSVATVPFTPNAAPVVARKVYRSRSNIEQFPATNDAVGFDSREYICVGVLNDNVSTLIHDNTPNPTNGSTIAAATFTAADGGAGNMEPGTFVYWVTTVNSLGQEKNIQVNNGTTAQNMTKSVTTTGKVNLSGLPHNVGDLARRIYRANGPYFGSIGRHAILVAEQRSTDPLWAGGTYVDNTSNATLGYGDGDILDQPAYTIGNEGGFRECLVRSIGQKLTLTGGTTSTTYTVRMQPQAGLRFVEQTLTPILWKSTQEATTITISTATQHCRRPAFADCAFYEVLDNCVDLTFEDCDVMGFNGDFGRVLANDEQRASSVTFRNCRSIANGRQGWALTSAYDVLFDNCKVIASGRSGLDIEPAGITGNNSVKRIYLKDCEFRAVTNGFIASGNIQVDEFRIERCSFITAPGIPGTVGITTLAGHVTLKDVYVPRQSVSIIGGRDVAIDGVTCTSMTVGGGQAADGQGVNVQGGGGYIRNVKLNTWGNQAVPFNCYLAGVSVSNITLNEPQNSGLEAVWTIPSRNQASNRYGPFQIAGTGTTGVLLDPGPMWMTRFPNTYKGVNAGKLHFPIGLDMLSESVVNVKGISSTSVRPHNHRITATVPAGDNTKTIPFPTRSVEGPTGYQLQAFQRSATTLYPAGSLAPATYYYRFGGRSLHSGAQASWFEASLVLASPNNCIRVAVEGMWGTSTQIDGLTVYRGTSSGNYNTRYDIIPVADPHGFGTPEAATSRYGMLDYGSVIATATQISPDAGAIGYNLTYPVTSPTPYVGTAAWTGSTWVPTVDQTGYEEDLNYTVTTETTWPTTVGVTKTAAGVTLTFGTAAPGGGGTATCMIGR